MLGAPGKWSRLRILVDRCGCMICCAAGTKMSGGLQCLDTRWLPGSVEDGWCQGPEEGLEIAQHAPPTTDTHSVPYVRSQFIHNRQKPATDQAEGAKLEREAVLSQSSLRLIHLSLLPLSPAPYRRPPTRVVERLWRRPCPCRRRSPQPRPRRLSPLTDPTTCRRRLRPTRTIPPLSVSRGISRVRSRRS
ncbi:hypothetical protein L227DRAFT_110902 [Lentinus tigrinus ALCF2SS1-6]|uniref:Uncharacterized protein n=1 Tax=Lentinus tigrinus ALCF2SS1-6 TaxID=1328759 RepID=A0A5C2S8Z3_9APHY|nr:hypothetical protein L227DRAFT_110902 [Lentinus tigrinus ALCF2SS1-6]